MPYIWGGTSDNTETDFGVTARGGYDCSGFVWRVYKLQSYPDEGRPRLDAHGPDDVHDQRRGPALEADLFQKLQPADVIFFGSRGPSRRGSQVFHTAIYVGNGWFIQSSDRASRSPSSPAGTRRSSPGAGGRCARQGSSPRKRTSYPFLGEPATSFG